MAIPSPNPSLAAGPGVSITVWLPSVRLSSSTWGGVAVHLGFLSMAKAATSTGKTTFCGLLLVELDVNPAGVPGFLALLLGDADERER